MLLVGYLLTAHYRWRDAKVHVMTVVNSPERVAEVDAALRLVLTNARLEAFPRVICRDERAITDLMKEESALADLVVVGLNLPKESDDDAAYMERNHAFLAGLPTTLLVLSARHFDGEPVLMDAEE